MQISDWGNVLIRHVCGWKHRMHSLWACPFSGVELRGAFHFQKNNISPAAPDLELILFSLWYWPIMNAHTKQQQDKVFETDFIDSQKSDPSFVHLLALSHIYIYIYMSAWFLEYWFIHHCFVIFQMFAAAQPWPPPVSLRHLYTCQQLEQWH